MIHLKTYLAMLVVLLTLDALWLGFVARDFYAGQLGGLLRDKINLAAAGGFYLAYAAGIVFFALAPALAEGSWRSAALHGALLGLLAYGTYDMTNLATLKNWPLAVSLADLAWGGVITGISALGGFCLARAPS